MTDLAYVKYLPMNGWESIGFYENESALYYIMDTIFIRVANEKPYYFVIPLCMLLFVLNCGLKFDSGRCQCRTHIPNPLTVRHLSIL